MDAAVRNVGPPIADIVEKREQFDVNRATEDSRQI
jgi:hypothetical protein